MTGYRRALAGFGALACGLAVAVAAYASHGLDGVDAKRAGLAALFAFGHGLALLLLVPAAVSKLRLCGVSALAAGLVLFSGSLLGAVFLAASTALAPAGGLLLMLGWLIIAADVLRR